MGIAPVADGGVCVADMMNSRVQVFDAARGFVMSFGRPGDRYGDMGKPRQVAVGPDGTYFVADADFAHVHLFNRAGQLLMLLGGPDEPIGGTPLPCGVAVAAEVPAGIAALVPPEFHADYFLFVANSLGERRLSLFAVDASE
jgi:DNA-binding beta-propeller fold protein YncE